MSFLGNGVGRAAIMPGQIQPQAVSYSNLDSTAIAPIAFKNKLINGNFVFWQRGTSSSASGYLADRWYCNSTGTTIVQSQQTFTPGQTTVPNEPQFFFRSVVSSVTGASNNAVLEQRIESIRTFAGQTVTISFYAKADSTKNIAVEFFQFFGTGGSPSSQIAGIGVSTFTLTSTWNKFTATVTIPSIVGKTIGTNGDDFLDMVFWFDAGSSFSTRSNNLGQQSGTFDIAQVQLESGTVATNFEMRPKQTELALCQRYYETSYSLGTFAGTASAGGARVAFQQVPTTLCGNTSFCVSKRAVPTVTIYSPGGSIGSVWTLASDSDTGGGATAGNIGYTGFRYIALSSGVGSGPAYSFHFVASAEL